MSKLHGWKFVLAGLIVFSFVHAQTAQANVKIKLLGVNPSQEKTQIVKLKTYLPQEVTLEDVVDYGDLNIAYDISKGAYAVFKDYELEAGETVEREILIKDIWIFPEEKLNNLRAEIDKTIDFIKGTEFEEQAEFLRTSLQEKLDKIEESQKSATINPQQHISYYRKNKELFKSAQEDLLLARSFMNQGKRLSAIKIWKLFVWVVVFLGALGASLFFVWRRQFKMIRSSGGKSDDEEKMVDILEDKPDDGEGEKEEIKNMIDNITTTDN